MPKKMKLNFKGGAEAVGEAVGEAVQKSKSKLPIFIGLGLLFLCCCIIVICIIIFASDSDESASGTSEESEGSGSDDSGGSGSGGSVEWTELSGKNCYYSDTALKGARKNIYKGSDICGDGSHGPFPCGGDGEPDCCTNDSTYDADSLDQCKQNCINDDNCNCITYNSTNNECRMRVDCNNDDSHCETNSNINTYTYDKPGHLQGYSDDIWDSYSSRHCGLLSTGVDAIYGNRHSGDNSYNQTYTYNTIDDCKKSCYENPECNCINYYSPAKLCSFRKECPDDPNAPYTYPENVETSGCSDNGDFTTSIQNNV